VRDQADAHHSIEFGGRSGVDYERLAGLPAADDCLLEVVSLYQVAPALPRDRLAVRGAHQPHRPRKHLSARRAHGRRQRGSGEAILPPPDTHPDLGRVLLDRDRGPRRQQRLRDGPRRSSHVRICPGNPAKEENERCRHQGRTPAVCPFHITPLQLLTLKPHPSLSPVGPTRSIRMSPSRGGVGQ
jgi:hypothetical protein